MPITNVYTVALWSTGAHSSDFKQENYQHLQAQIRHTDQSAEHVLIYRFWMSLAETEAALPFSNGNMEMNNNRI